MSEISISEVESLELRLNELYDELSNLGSGSESGERAEIKDQIQEVQRKLRKLRGW